MGYVKVILRVTIYSCDSMFIMQVIPRTVQCCGIIPDYEIVIVIETC